MRKNLKILKMKDKSDKNEVHKDLIFDLPMRLIIAMRTGGGKTNLLANLLIRKKEFYGDDFKGDDIYIITPLINDNKLEQLIEVKEIPDENIFYEYDEELLTALYDKLTEEFKERTEAGKKPHHKIIVFDDISYTGKLRSGNFNIVNKIFNNGRKHNISAILTTQYYYHISPNQKNNASGIIVGNTSDKALDSIMDDNNYLGSKKAFRKLFRTEIREKHDFLVINYSNNRENLYLNKDFERIDEEQYIN